MSCETGCCSLCELCHIPKCQNFAKYELWLLAGRVTAEKARVCEVHMQEEVEARRIEDERKSALSGGAKSSADTEGNSVSVDA